MSVNLKVADRRLNDTCRQSLEGAAGLCLSRTHYDVEIEHLLFKLLEAPDTDLARILRHFEVDASRLSRDLTRALDRLKTGNARTPALSPRVPRLVEQAWTVASIDFGARRCAPGTCSSRCSRTTTSARLAPRDLAGARRHLRRGRCEGRSPTIVGLGRGPRGAGAAPRRPAAAARRGRAPGQDAALDQFTIDLTAKRPTGKIDPVLGRDFEIRQIIDILMRRRQNNPILTGEAGVGKTAVVEGFALRIAAGDVPAAAAATWRSARSTWACCRPAPASRASSRTG